MKVAFTLAAAAVALFGAAYAVDIDNGFTQDGATTYCMGVSSNGTVGTLSFDDLYASNVGRCPVGVSLTLTASKFHVSDLVTVKWKAKINTGVSNSIFPNAINTATKLPGAVSQSSLFACTSGTNCATNVAGTKTGADGTSTGDFAVDGTKPLETNTFTLAAAGEYIIVGLVALPGDSTLSLSAEEYIVFKKISIVAAGSTLSSSSSTTGSSSWISSASASDTMDLGSSSSANVVSTTAPDGTTNQHSSGSTTSTTTSTGTSNFLGTNGVIIISALVACCIVGVVGFAFVMRRRKEKRMNANKAFDMHSPSMSSETDDRVHHGGKIDLTYVANFSARNKKKSNNMMSEDSSMPIMASAERGSELDSSNGSSLHSLPKSSLDSNAYSEALSYGASGSEAPNEAEIDAYRLSNLSNLSSVAANQSEKSSISNFGDMVVSARQNKYLHSGEWNDSESSRMDSRLDSMEQEELKARGFGSIGGISTVSGFSEDNTSRITGLSDQEVHIDQEIGFSMSSGTESRFTEDFRPTDDSRAAAEFRSTGFSEAIDHSRHQSEVSVDSYGFRPSRSSADSYGSGMSPYSRESSRISGFSVDSSVGNSSRGNRD